MEKLYATGKRKTAVARVWLTPGEGKILVNGKPYSDYFKDHIVAEDVIYAPFRVTGLTGKFDINCTVEGGGKSAQAEAIRHGIAKALVQYKEELKPLLKKLALLQETPEKKREKNMD